MKRVFDLTLALLLILILFFVLFLIAVLLKLFSKGPVLYWSKRIGKDNRVFSMPKFRTMFIETPEIPTHLMLNSEKFVTPIGAFLRKTSFDELPQLLSILKGDMSFVGPRPVLLNQDDIITLRIEKGVDKLVPGVTGWAQINGRDQISIVDKVNLDEEYLNRKSFWFDMQILWSTLFKVLNQDGVSH